MAGQGPAGGWPGGDGGGLCPPNQGSNPPTAAPPHLGAQWGWFLGRHGAQHIPPQQRQHLFIAAPAPPPATDTARRSLPLKRGGLIGHQPRGRGSCPPGAVPCGGSGVRGGGTGPGTDAGITPRGRRRDNAALCRRYHRGWEAEAGKQGAAGWHDAVPAGTATATAGDGRATASGAAGAGRCCRAAGARPGGTPASGRCWAPEGTRWPPWHLRFPRALGWLVPVPAAVAAAGGDGRWMALAESLLRAAFPMTPGPAEQEGE